MRKDNKVNLKGAKNLENKKFKGNVASIVKKITAATISLGLAVSAPQAIKMYKEWETNRNLDTLNSILNLDENNVNSNISIDENVLEEFELILQEYRQALEDNDENRKAELDNQVIEKDYYRLIAKELEKSIIRNLGYNPEGVRILIDRSNLLYLVDKEEIEKGVIYTTIGTLSDKVKIKDTKRKFCYN